MENINESSAFYHLPSSFGQKRIWFAEQLYPDSPVYNIPLSFKINGLLKTELLEKTFSLLLERHEVLRTTFVEIEEELVQRVSLYPPIQKLKMTLKEDILRNESLESYFKKFAIKPFDLKKGPLMQYELIKIDQRQHILLLNVHHIIFDAWSVDVLKKDFLLIYQSIKNNEDYEIEPLDLQYADFANWEKEMLEDASNNKKIDFWKEYLKNPPSPIEMPYKLTGSNDKSNIGSNYKFAFPIDLVKKVRDYTGAQGTTLNNFFLSAFQVLLYRYSGEKDIIVGTPVANRKLAFTHDLIGFFVNTLPVRLHIKPYSIFKNVMKEVQKTFLKIYECSEIPFERIVEEVNPEREVSQNPIFQTLFTYNERQEGSDDQELEIIEKKINTDTSKFDFALYVSTHKDNGFGEIEFNADTFDMETIDRFAQHYINFIKEIVDKPDLPICKIEFRTKHEINFFLKNTYSNIENQRYVSDWFENIVKDYGDNIALKYKNKHYTYKELNCRVKRVASGLQSLGIGTGKIIAVKMKKGLNQIAVILGILKSGNAYLPIEYTTPKSRIAYILDDSSSVCIVSDTHEKCDESMVNAIDSEFLINYRDEDYIPSEYILNPSELPAYVIYTSGSTGRPKGVCISHSSLVSHITSYLKEFPFEQNEIVLQNITFAFDASITEIFSTLLSGNTLVLTEHEKQFDIEYLANLFLQEGITRAQLFHSLINNLLELTKFNELKKLKYIFTGGDILSQQLVDRFYKTMKNSATLINMYGPTETTVAASFHICQSERQFHSVPIGKPFESHDFLILDETMQPVPQGSKGELYIGGPCVALRYLGSTLLSNKSFLDIDINGCKSRFYKSGDIVQQLNDGSLMFISRRDNQVKVRGFRIDLQEIKDAALRNAEIDEAFVMVEEIDSEKDIFLFLKLKDGYMINAKEIKNRLSMELPFYMIPKNITFVEVIPKSNNGKVIKSELPLEKNDLANSCKKLPTSDLEKKLLLIWKDVLKLKDISIDDDFFDIGGHSIKALELMGSIKKVLNMELPLSLLFSKRTIENIANYISNANSSLNKKSSVVSLLKVNNHSGKKLFLIHPGGGGILCYMPLANAITKSFSIYGIQSVGYESDEKPILDIKIMAKCYVNEVQKIQPHGPYSLAGWSMGGTIAFEMAKIFEQNNQEVDFVGLIDAYPFQKSNENVVLREPVDVWAHNLAIDTLNWSQLSEQEKYDEILKSAKKKGIFPESAQIQDVRRVLNIMGANNEACDQYECTGPIKSDMHLFYCSEQDFQQPHLLVNKEEWKKRTTGFLHEIPILGNHNTLIEKRYSDTLGKQISQILRGDYYENRSNRSDIKVTSSSI